MLLRCVILRTVCMSMFCFVGFVGQTMGQHSGQQEVPVNRDKDRGLSSVGFQLGYYHNDDKDDGNPFLDEELTVVEPVVVFDYQVSQDSVVWGKISYDYVSSASIKRLDTFAQRTGASGDYYVGVDLGWRKSYETGKDVGVFGSGSAEFDYRSFGLGGDVGSSANEENATWKLSLSGFYDEIDIIRFNGDESEGDDNRVSVASTFNWYQVINPTTHGDVGATLSIQSGFLETAYNGVVIEDGVGPNPTLANNASGREVTEQLPDTRLRGAVFGRVRKSMLDTLSFELGGRLYADDWGITSLSLEPRVYLWVVEDLLSLRGRYRFYAQTEADAYQKHFTIETDERTQDTDLSKFRSNTTGLKLSWFANDMNTYELSADFVWHSQGLDQILSSFSYTRNF